jgi:signal peptidase I
MNHHVTPFIKAFFTGPYFLFLLHWPITWALSTRSTFTTSTIVKSAESTQFPFYFNVTIPLDTVRPAPRDPVEQFQRLWNDKRSLADVLRDQTSNNEVPYCLVSETFDIPLHNDNNLTFQVLLYPRGVYGSSTSVGGNNVAASAYLSFHSHYPGVEADVAWRLKLIDATNNETLPIVTSGGLPRSNSTFSAAMTFCTPSEALDSVGRTADWGSSTWRSLDPTKSSWRAELKLTVFDVRNGCTSFTWPPRGALGDVWTAVNSASPQQVWRAGQVVTVVPQTATERQRLAQRYGIQPGVDYRIMTMTDGTRREIFTTANLSPSQRGQAQLALRPVGWKQQTKIQAPKDQSSWPVEVPLSAVAPVLYSRVNPRATLPRFVAFSRDIRALVITLALALAPLATAVVGRQFVTLTEIPSASMDPTLQKGDVLLVEKLPGVYNRVHRGDIVLFRAPNTLRDIIEQSTGRGPPPNQLFVKRLVGLPGDRDIVWQGQQVTIEGQPAVGPSRTLCDDEPLRLIDAYLQNGRGTAISALEKDETYVLGDCQAVSVDSRVFGPLPVENIVGRPVARLWPLSRVSWGAPPPGG